MTKDEQIAKPDPRIAVLAVSDEARKQVIKEYDDLEEQIARLTAEAERLKKWNDEIKRISLLNNDDALRELWDSFQKKIESVGYTVVLDGDTFYKFRDLLVLKDVRISQLTAHISLLVEGLKKYGKHDWLGDLCPQAHPQAFENGSRCLCGLNELLTSPPISHHIEIREAEKKVVEAAKEFQRLSLIVAYDDAHPDDERSEVDEEDVQSAEAELYTSVEVLDNLQSKQNP